jgi:hypothetical protein
MNTNILVMASALSDHDLLARLEVFAGKEREASTELVAHLAALDSRPALFAAQGYGSLFTYCTQALRLSEDATCNRVTAARACRRFPLVLDMLASGSLSLTSIRRLAPHLTAENHQTVLAKAMDKTRREIEALVAALAPRPDLPSTVRKLACRTATRSPLGGPVPDLAPGPRLEPAPGLEPGSWLGSAMTTVTSTAGTALALTRSPLPATPLTIVQGSAPPAAPRPIVQASAPERYRVQFTIGKETHEKLRRLQALLRREIPDGDPGALFDRALTVLLEKVEKTKLAAAAKPQPLRPIGLDPGPNAPIRPETDPNPPVRPEADRKPPICPDPDPNPPLLPRTDKDVRKRGMPSLHVPPASPAPPAPPAPRSRTVPREVKREVWRRDAGRCAFVATTGRRCMEGTFLEFHHVQPFAKLGPATVENIALRCWRHNQYEAELIFGPRHPSIVRGVRPCP